MTAIIPTWKMLTTLDMSRNFIRCIDESVVSYHCTLYEIHTSFHLSFLFECKFELFLIFLIQKLIPEVEFLDLSHNELSLVENLQVCCL